MWKHASAVMELGEAVESWIHFHLNVSVKAGRPFFGRWERERAAAASSLRVGPRIGSGCHDCEDEDEPLSLVLVMTVIPTMNRRKKEKRKKDTTKEMNMILMLPLLMTAMMLNSSTSQPFT